MYYIKNRSSTRSSYKDFKDLKLKKKELKNKRQDRLAVRENKRYNEALS